MKSDLRLRFWRYADTRYRNRPPHPKFERSAIRWAILLAIVWVASAGAVYLASLWRSRNILVLAGLGAGLVLGLLLAALPLVLALMHRRIRLEREKGPNALYEKAVEHWHRLNR